MPTSECAIAAKYKAAGTSDARVTIDHGMNEKAIELKDSRARPRA
jgi:hypothetical protein